MKAFFKKLSAIILSLVMVLSVSITADAASAKISKSKATVYVGQTISVSVKNVKESNNIKWSASNNKVKITPDRTNVKIKGVKKGNATVTAKIGIESYKCKVMVKNPAINKKELYLNKGDTFKLKLNGTSVKKVKSSNKKVATVNKKGVVTAKIAGTAIITLIGKNKKKYSCKVTVNKKIKIGFIFLHDENSTYDLNIMNAAKKACKALSVKYVFKTNIPESSECYKAAADLVDQGCNIIFADSYGHEDFLIKAAKKYKNVQFCHASGVKAHTEKLKNYHNAYAAVYEGGYLAGVAAGMKLNELKKSGELKGTVPKLGYVGSYTYAEVISSYTAFYLGAKSVCKNVVMDVKFTSSWYDEYKEKKAAKALIKRGADIISQYSDSMGVPNACEAAGIPNITYNGSTVDVCPNTFLVSSKINWTPYFKYIIKCVQRGKAIKIDWTGTLKTGSVELSAVNKNVAAKGTKNKIKKVKSNLKAGKIHVFDTSKFTVKGKTLKSYKADVDVDYTFESDTEVISKGYFHESEYRSAPYFDIAIDGITLLNTGY